MQFAIDDECAWNEIVPLVRLLLSQYCTAVMSPEAMMAFAFYLLL